MRVRPIGNKVVVRVPVEQERKSVGGIILPDSAAKEQQILEVVAVGEGSYNESGTLIPLAIAVGNKVLIPKFSGIEIKLDNETHLVLKEEDIIAVIED
jgi:chaperonin GroES